MYEISMHQRQVTDEPLRLPKDQYGSGWTQSMPSFWRHWENRHKEDDAAYKCPVCETTPFSESEDDAAFFYYS